MPKAMMVHVLQGVGEVTDLLMSILDKGTQENPVSHCSLISDISLNTWGKKSTLWRENEKLRFCLFFLLFFYCTDLMLFVPLSNKSYMAMKQL